MNKLELKHIAPYLPYGLKINTKYGIDVPEDGHNYTVIGVCLKRSVFSYNNLMFEVLEKPNKEISHYYNDFKPILRPLSDLELDLWNIINDVDKEFYIEYSSDDGNIYLRDVCDLNFFELSRTLNVLNQLFKNHFDVFGLIEKGLAIDKNTLK
ncbi:hypothetical protein [Gaetbulibacter sp. PBL-D1]|uniref:hypothetical protein n=1 Tax=Gaetbulibacter sp. PBL-D1 TaxID=3422594 RepID=UPI003D2EBECB